MHITLSSTPARRTSLALVVALVAAVLALVAPSAATAATSYAVSGAVRYSNGSPVNGIATVYQLQGASYQAVNGSYFNGAVDFDLEPGTYKLRFESWDTGAEKWYAVGGATGADEANASPLVVSTADVAFSQVVFGVRNVTVTVKDNHNLPVPGVSVHGALTSDLEGDYLAGGTTDAAGVATLRNLPAGQTLYVGAFDEDTGHYEMSAVATVAAGTTNVPASLTMLRRSTVSGTVTSSTNAPLSLIDVTVLDSAGDKVGGATTDSQGKYTAAGLAPGDYTLKFEDELAVNGGDADYATEFYDNQPDFASAQAFTVAANTDYTGKNAQLTSVTPVTPTGVDLAGTVKGAGAAPLSNVLVQVYRNGVAKEWAVTGRGGKYAFSDLTAGSYRVSFSRLSGPTDSLPYVDQWFLGARSSSAATPVNVTPDVAGAAKDITLQQYGVITGSVSDAGGQPVGQSEVAAIDLDGNYADGASGAGTYRLLVRPGQYRVHFDGYDSAADESFLGEFWDNATSFAGSKAVNVGSGQTVANINARLTKALETSAAPRVAGSPLVGKTLSASTGTWNLMAENDYAYTWFRGAAAVGTGTTYKLTTADVGAKISVRVQAWNGSRTGTSTSTQTAVVKRPSATKVTGASPSAKTVKLTVTVSGTGLASPGGTLTIKRGTKVLKTKVAVVKGKAVVTLKAQPKGKQSYTAVYSGTAAVAGGTSTKVTVKVK